MQKRVERYTLHNSDDADDNGIVTGEAATTLTSHPSEGSTSGSATRSLAMAPSLSHERKVKSKEG